MAARREPPASGATGCTAEEDVVKVSSSRAIGVGVAAAALLTGPLVTGAASAAPSPAPTAAAVTPVASAWYDPVKNCGGRGTLRNWGTFTDTYKAINFALGYCRYANGHVSQVNVAVERWTTGANGGWVRLRWMYQNGSALTGGQYDKGQFQLAKGVTRYFGWSYGGTGATPPAGSAPAFNSCIHGQVDIYAAGRYQPATTFSGGTKCG